MTLKHTTRIILLLLMMFFLLQLLSGTPIYKETKFNADQSSQVHLNTLLIYNNNAIVPIKAVHRPSLSVIFIKFLSSYITGLIALSLINSTIYCSKVLLDTRKYIKKIITQHIEGNKYKYPYFTLSDILG